MSCPFHSALPTWKEDRCDLMLRCSLTAHCDNIQSSLNNPWTLCEVHYFLWNCYRVQLFNKLVDFIHSINSAFFLKREQVLWFICWTVGDEIFNILGIKRSVSDPLRGLTWLNPVPALRDCRTGNCFSLNMSPLRYFYDYNVQLSFFPFSDLSFLWLVIVQKFHAHNMKEQ